MRAAHLSLQLARPKRRSHRQSVCESVCAAQVCASSSVCVCQSVNQPVANNTNKPQQKFNNISMSLPQTEGSLSNLSCRLLALCLSLYHSFPLSSISLRLSLFPICPCPCHSLSVCPACQPACCRRQHYPVST